jgi:hypothetical protein
MRGTAAREKGCLGFRGHAVVTRETKLLKNKRNVRIIFVLGEQKYNTPGKCRSLPNACISRHCDAS